MFFRIVNTKYKEKEYHYLKLLESYRHGKNIKQRALMNIRNLNHMSHDQAEDFTRELQQILALGKTFRDKKLLEPRLVDIAFLLAAEYSLKPKVINGNKLKKMLADKEKRNSPLNSSEGIINHIKNIASRHSSIDLVLLWLQGSNEYITSQDKGLGILFNCQGYILGHFSVNDTSKSNWLEDVQHSIKESNDLLVHCSILSDNVFKSKVTKPKLESTSEMYIPLRSGRSFSKEIKKFYVARHFDNPNFPMDSISSALTEIYYSQHWFVRRLRPAFRKNCNDGLAMLELWIVAHTLYKLINLSAKKFDLET